MFQALTNFVTQMQQSKLSMFKVPDTARRGDSAWYVGMPINPVEFSQQLSHLQLGLQGESQSIAAPLAHK